MRALRRREQGNPAAALALIATIFAIGFTIKLLPPATRQALVPVAHRDLPSRALLIWNAHAPSFPTAQFGDRAVIAQSLPRRSAQREGGEPTGDVPLTFDRDPGEAPLIPATPLSAVALPMAIAAVHAETAISNSPLVAPFTKTRSVLRMAFEKTGSAIKTAASGTFRIPERARRSPS